MERSLWWHCPHPYPCHTLHPLVAVGLRGLHQSNGVYGHSSSTDHHSDPAITAVVGGRQDGSHITGGNDGISGSNVGGHALCLLCVVCAALRQWPRTEQPFQNLQHAVNNHSTNMGVMLVNTIGVLPPIAEKQKALARASKAEMKRVHPLNDNGSGDLSHDKKCPCYHEESEPVSDEAMQKRSLWRKILGKGPKCRCAKIESERRIGKLEISDEYVGFISVRVSGKRIPYTREMHKRRRQLLNKMEAISE